MVIQLFLSLTFASRNSHTTVEPYTQWSAMKSTLMVKAMKANEIKWIQNETNSPWYWPENVFHLLFEKRAMWATYSLFVQLDRRPLRSSPFRLLPMAGGHTRIISTLGAHPAKCATLNACVLFVLFFRVELLVLVSRTVKRTTQNWKAIYSNQIKHSTTALAAVDVFIKQKIAVKLQTVFFNFNFFLIGRMHRSNCGRAKKMQLKLRGNSIKLCRLEWLMFQQWDNVTKFVLMQEMVLVRKSL